MPSIRVKLRRIGNSLGVILPKNVITGISNGDEIEVNVITQRIESSNKVITSKKKKFNAEWCEKHKVFKGSCGCK
jgi:antitoxin component of MazEF toxin-antitoxin module